MNWIDGAVTHQSAWNHARSQSAPVTVVINGTTKSYGVVFNPSQFERAAYNGYVAYGQSMSDGIYHPLGFEQWVISFRKSPDFDQNDAPAHVKRSLSSYVAALESLNK